MSVCSGLIEILLFKFEWTKTPKRPKASYGILFNKIKLRASSFYIHNKEVLKHE